ncbi:hypothetical protein C0216_20535 [Streptomyces globosus]|uniref:Uncharacterized protein n=1 Tax=Streptomyces globosus TaxID=68209 RepID=A0A344U3P0_9ACTN|nr:hypothetical protein [Streptomyces globosus]AXE25511.1 hypothetical protein C0216_20535 [Streptomyces globosus]
MSALDTSAPRTGRRHSVLHRFEESVRQQRQQPPPDPPIYRALMDHWTADGRTLPGRPDPEWTRVAASPIWPTGPLFESRP